MRVQAPRRPCDTLPTDADPVTSADPPRSTALREACLTRRRDGSHPPRAGTWNIPDLALADIFICKASFSIVTEIQK